jgi:hypothetical protein
MALKKSNVKGDPASTIIGVITALLTLGVMFNYVSSEEKESLLANLAVAIPAVTSVVTGTILIFSRIFHKD